MAAPNSTLPASILTAAIEDQQVIKYFSMIGPTILVYDWFLTIDSEITHVWSRRWHIIELLYLFSRYMPFVDTPIMVNNADFFLVNPSIEACRTALTAQVLLYCIGSSISKLIFMIRTWAIWERGKVVGLILFTETTVALVALLYLGVIYANSLTYFPGYNLGGCFILTSSKVALLELGIVLLLQFTYLVFVVLKVYPAGWREGDLSGVILQDGVLFYIMLFVLIVINMMFVLRQGTLSTVLTVPTRICSSIFATRIVLHLRDVDKRRNEDPFTATAVRTVMFADVLGQTEGEDQTIEMVSAQDPA